MRAKVRVHRLDEFSVRGPLGTKLPLPIEMPSPAAGRFALPKWLRITRGLSHFAQPCAPKLQKFAAFSMSQVACLTIERNPTPQLNLIKSLGRVIHTVVVI